MDPEFCVLTYQFIVYIRATIVCEKVRLDL